MRQARQRSLALGAVRSQVRTYGIDPVTITAANAHVVMDEMARQYPDLVVSQWYVSANNRQMDLFYREWEQWRRAYQQE